MATPAATNEPRPKRKADSDGDGLAKRAPGTTESLVLWYTKAGDEGFDFDGDVALLRADSVQPDGPLGSLLARMGKAKKGLIPGRKGGVAWVVLTLEMPNGDMFTYQTAAVSFKQMCDLETVEQFNGNGWMRQAEILKSAAVEELQHPHGYEQFMREFRDLLERRRIPPQRFATRCNPKDVFLFVPAALLALLGEDTPRVFPVARGNAVGFCVEASCWCEKRVTVLTFGENSVFLVDGTDCKCDPRIFM